MTVEQKLKKLQREGYKVMKDLNSGKVIAKKGQSTYHASSVTQLYKKIFE